VQLHAISTCISLNFVREENSVVPDETSSSAGFEHLISLELCSDAADRVAVASEIAKQLRTLAKKILPGRLLAHANRVGAKYARVQGVLDHSPAFWSLLETYYPGARQADQRLSNAVRDVPPWLELAR